MQQHSGGTGGRGQCGSNTLCLTGGSAGQMNTGGSVGGYLGTGGSFGVGGATTGTGGASPNSLRPIDGWLDVESNVYGMQGAIFWYADSTTLLSVSSNFDGSNACIAGTAALVDLNCAANDCYGEYWGAAIGLNLNQPIDPATGQAVDPPLSYDASTLYGFGFTLTGPAVPVGMRFLVENAAGQYCTPAATPLFAGSNYISFSDLRTECWSYGGDSPDTSQIVKIAWQVVTNPTAEVPFDFCVSDIAPLPL